VTYTRDQHIKGQISNCHHLDKVVIKVIHPVCQNVVSAGTVAGAVSKSANKKEAYLYKRGIILMVRNFTLSFFHSLCSCPHQIHPERGVE
jgi:hypothetical protein